MSLIELEEDILHVPAKTRVITINLVGAMGAGVAKRFRDNIPGIYKHYKKMYPKISPHQFISFSHQGEIHLMVPTKIDWRDPSPIDLVISNLEKLADLVRKHPEMSPVVLPPFGCGNGGLDYQKDIRHHYVRLFEDHPSTFIVTFGNRNYKR